MDGSVFEEKSFLRCWGWPSLLNWVGVLVLSLLLKLPPRKLESNSFYEVFFPEVALYLYKFTVHPCMEYCCHVWAGATSCFLEFLDKLQKWICRTVGPSLATSLESLAHRRSVTSLSLFYRCYFGRCSSELAQLVPLPFFVGGWLVILIDYMIFLSPFLDVTRMSMSTVFFNRTTRLWNSLPIECIPLVYYLSGFKSRINRHL